VSLERLAAEYGTPLYVYSADHIAGRLALFAHAFASTRHLVCYSVKANSALAILRMLDRHHAGFDIVSGGELERVLRVSRKAARRCVFSGVGKTAEEIDLALKSNILIFNVESEGELELLARRAAVLRKTARYALRVNPDVFAETHPYISTGLREHKFGIEIGRARAIYAEASRHKRLVAQGVSVHIGSQIRSAAPFGAAAMRVVELVRQLRADGHPIDSLDLGGGLGIDYGAESSVDPAAAIEQYAAALMRALALLEPVPRLLLEPGRFLVAQAGALLTRVLYLKRNGEKNFVITDAGMNDLIRPALYQAHHEIVPVTQREGSGMVADIVGPVCESGDFFARDRAVAALETGDLLAILDAGAYGLSLSSNYNTRMRPAEVLISGRRVRRIRRRETIRDLLRPEL
jgi:diaminopimelate decarboxylase